MDGLQIKIYNSVSQEWEWQYAYDVFGIMMGDGFLDALKEPVPLKPFVENQSRLIDGKRVVVNNPRKDSRSVDLIFDISGTTPADFEAKKDAFLALLYQGEIVLGFPGQEKWSQDKLPGIPPTTDKFHLIHQNKVTYSQDLTQTGCKMAVRFEEPNPANRT